MCNHCYRIKLLYSLRYLQQDTEEKKALPEVKEDFKDYNSSQQEIISCCALHAVYWRYKILIVCT
jgi:hypothetical protein